MIPLTTPHVRAIPAPRRTPLGYVAIPEPVVDSAPSGFEPEKLFAVALCRTVQHARSPRHSVVAMSSCPVAFLSLSPVKRFAPYACYCGRVWRALSFSVSLIVALLFSLISRGVARHDSFHPITRASESDTHAQHAGVLSRW
jgi:hypothetical protein